MPENNQSLEIRSNEMEEVVGNIPTWIIRWGITVLFAVAVLGLLIANMVRYPDMLQATVLMQSENQPGKVTIRRTDENANFKFNYLVKNGDQVVPGDTLLTRYDPKTAQSYYTITPMEGKIYITKGIDQKNTLDEIIWVVPKSSRAEIKVKYNSKRAGNVKVGQSVRIELSDFPSNEYGFLEGTIASILPVQMDGEHLAYVELNQKKIITSEQKEIPILPVMEGSAEIVLSDRSIFQRIFGSMFN
ncbi:HlyD family efflux transporter periplasmic adaptor subunit [Chitinophaga filiformis]|uniref:HlyD family efflux transporter periplasmic adaptor subunit n=1 Tax=Chitinophaga filiformis TaxID=104663 RepID=UPI001F1F19E0|nr:HlyD family efflux transporter periplasmic adaptor subunit [Chitinophaga filiformis]MCF6402943.1 HlyD family efflux transporter periplasmic adaptor subunit [Chitinophaga filiformis]